MVAEEVLQSLRDSARVRDEDASGRQRGPDDVDALSLGDASPLLDGAARALQVDGAARGREVQLRRASRSSSEPERTRRSIASPRSLAPFGSTMGIGGTPSGVNELAAAEGMQATFVYLIGRTRV